jgi:hypothetical protein
MSHITNTSMRTYISHFNSEVGVLAKALFHFHHIFNRWQLLTDNGPQMPGLLLTAWNPTISIGKRIFTTISRALPSHAKL